MASKACVRLVNLLMQNGKVKPAQQIMQLLVKDVELIGHPEGSGDKIQDRGVRQFFKQAAKA